MDQKIKVAFDVNCLSTPRLTGVGNVALNIFKQLKKNDQIDVIPYLKLSRVKKSALVKMHIGVHPKIWYPWFPVFPPKFDIFHGPDFKVPKGHQFKKLVTVHDIVEFDGDFNSTKFIQQAQRNFKSMLYDSQPDHIHTVSHFTQDRVCHHFPEFCKKITTIYPGIDHLNHPQDILSKTRQLPEKYFLFVGTLEKRKNLKNILQAFDSFSKTDTQNIALVLVGRFGFGDTEIKNFLINLNNSKIFHFDNVENFELQQIYLNSLAFIFPSLYEGFGLPVLEAMSLQVPVITSSEGALNEISGSAALKIQPNSVSELIQAMNQIATDSGLRQKLRELGASQAQKFTWEKTAAELHKLYVKIINS